MPRAIVKGKIVRVPYGQKLPEPKRKTTKPSNRVPPLPEKDTIYQPALLKGEKIISFRKTRVAKKPDGETDETPYGKINVINDDFTWRGIRGAHHSGMLFLTNKRLVHVIKRGSVMGLCPTYLVDFDRPLSTLHGVTAEVDIKHRLRGHGKRLAVQYFKGNVDMFGDIILARRDGAPVVETFKERKPIEITREKMKRLVLLDERKPVAVPEREEAFEKRGLPEKRRFHAFGNVDEFAKKIKIAAGIE